MIERAKPAGETWRAVFWHEKIINLAKGYDIMITVKKMPEGGICLSYLFDIWRC